jgi:hypothetical protein
VARPLRRSSLGWTNLMADLPSGRCAAWLREADSADDLLPMRPSPSFGEDLAERRSEARSGMAARSLTMSSIVLPQARVRSASSLRRESWLAPWLDAQAIDALPVAAFPDPLVSKSR